MSKYRLRCSRMNVEVHPQHTGSKRRHPHLCHCTSHAVRYLLNVCSLSLLYIVLFRRLSPLSLTAAHSLSLALSLAMTLRCIRIGQPRWLCWELGIAKPLSSAEKPMHFACENWNTDDVTESAHGTFFYKRANFRFSIRSNWQFLAIYYYYLIFFFCRKTLFPVRCDIYYLFGVIAQ